MQNENPNIIDVIIEKCIELEDSSINYCINTECDNCNFMDNLKQCRNKTNLLMFLNGYRMGTCRDQERKQIDDYLQSNFPSFMRSLDNINH